MLKRFNACLNFSSQWKSRTRSRWMRSKRRLVLESLESRRVMAAFTPGNLLVLQSNDSSSSTASGVTFLEYTPSGSLVQAIPVTSSGSHSLALRGDSTTEGILNLSSDGQWVTFGGARIDAGSATSTNASGVARAIGKVGVDGVVDTSQTLSDAYQGDSFRSVVTDNGSRYWTSGAGTTTTGGVRYVQNTTDTTSVSLVANGGNSRQIQILDGNLFVSSGSNTPGRSVFHVGVGLPTSGTPTLKNAIPIAASQQYNSFYFADLINSVGWDGTIYDTLYTVDTNGTAGAVDKWTFNGTTWTLSGTNAYANMANITGATSGTEVKLFGTTKETGGSLLTITDTGGYAGAFTGTWSPLDTPVTATGPAAFRGITRVPRIATTELSIAATDAVKLEGDSGTTSFTFSVSRSLPLTGTSTANWSVAGVGPNAATASDFVGSVLPSGTVTFLEGESIKTIVVEVSGDLTNEPNEKFSLTLSSPVGATLAVPSAEGIINNDDAATELSITALNASKAEGNIGTNNFTFTLTRQGSTAGITTTVNYTVTGTSGTPAAPDDFVGNSYPTGQVTFAPGQTSVTLSIPVNGDSVVEADENFLVTLSNPSGGAAIVGFSANGSILNDDSLFAITPAVATQAEGNSGTSMIQFTVTRSGDLSQSSNVQWATEPQGVLPASSSDFAGNAFPSGQLNFLANEATKTIAISVQGDTTLEGNEAFAVNLTSASIGSIGSGSATGVILNDDFQTLNPGDIVITAFMADNPDSFSFVPLVDLQPNASIVFTDNAWNGTSLLANEGFFTYTAPAAGLSKGTSVVIEYDSANSTITFLAGTGTGSILGNFGFSTDGDSLLAFIGLSTSPTFLFGATTWGEYLVTGVPNANQTFLPNSLSVGTTAVAPLGIVGPPVDEVDNGFYNHAVGTMGTPAQIRSLVADRNNWFTFDLPTDPVPLGDFTVLPAPSATVISRQVFYNRSLSTVFGNGSGNPVNSIDPSKSALMPGSTASFANYTNYARGLNGILVDIAGLNSASSSDFLFATSDGVNPFVAAPAPATITVLPGQGVNGSSRVKIEFEDNAIRNTWLRITILANANTNLASNDLFYFGNAIGDFNVGNTVGANNAVFVRVNATDIATVRQNQLNQPDAAVITNVYDVDKNGRVNSIDTSIVRQNVSGNVITLFTAPASLPPVDAYFSALASLDEESQGIDWTNLQGLSSDTADREKLFGLRRTR